MRRNIFQPRESAIVHLLLAAWKIEFHHLHVEWIVKIGDGRVVESKMAVFPAAE